jgi:glycosyltransferase involved in cell wall biosynthesis
LKILVLSLEFPPNGGGAGVVAYQTCTKLAEVGFDVTLMTGYSASLVREVFSFNVIPVNLIPKFWFLSFFKKINASDYDVILLNDPGAIYLAGLYLCSKDLSKCLCYLHGSEPEFIFEKPNFFKKLSLFKYFYSRSLQKSKLVLSPSHYMKDKFLSRVTGVLADNNILPVYFGVDEKLFQPRTCNILKEKYSNPTGKTFISVSRIEEKKGYLKKYEIFKKYLQVDNNATWLVVGTGRLLDSFMQRVMDEGFSDSIKFIGHVKRSELPYYYALADVFWLLSDYDESFGLVYVEAQLCGVPCLGYKRAGVVEAIPNGSGLLVEDAVECFEHLKSGTIFTLDRESIKRNALKFSLDAYATTLIKVVNNVGGITQ